MTQQYWVGEVLVDLSRNQINYNDEFQTLQPKALDVLTCLAKHQGQVVSQDDLFDTIWGGTIVSPNTLQRCIAQLRKALGDDSKQQKVIRTHAKKGYSLESPVRWEADVQKQDTNPGFGDEHSVGDDTMDSSNHIDAAGNDFSGEQPVQLSDSAPTQAPVLTSNQASTQTPTPAPIRTLVHSNRSQSHWLVSAVLSGVFVICLLFLLDVIPESDYPISIADIRPITSTDNRELASIYSPDGQYVVFRRYPEVMCFSHLWAKDLQTQQEFRLTQNPGTYGRPSFSEDGTRLAFIKQQDCTTVPDQTIITQKTCFELQSMDFNEALKSPVLPSVHMECTNSEIRDAKWLQGDDIAMLQDRAGRWQLVRYSMSQDKTQTIYSVEEGNLVHYDYSPALNRIALVSVQEDRDFYLSIINPDGDIVSKHLIQYPAEITRYRHIYPNFSPVDNRLIFSTGRQLFTLSYEGKIQKISLPLDKAMGTPVFHPAGKKMLAIKGYYDSDVSLVSLAQFHSTGQVAQPGLQNNQFEYQVIDRSTMGENFARFQPRGQTIAWWSNRSGISQIWLTDKQGSRMLTRFPMDTYVAGYAWSQDGKSLLVNASSELWQVFVDGNMEKLSMNAPIAQLFDWDSSTQTALALAAIDGIETFVEIDLANSSVKTLNLKKVIWAQKAADGTVIYADKLGRFWRPGPAEDKLIPALSGQGSDKRFAINNQRIYGINDDFQLWFYDLGNKQFQLMAQLPDTVDFITGAGDEYLLMTIRIAARKDVVEMSLN